MTFLSIMQGTAKNAGIAVPSTVGGTDPDTIKLSEFINESGLEIRRRVDWRALRKVAAITGDGTAAPKPIAPDFDRLPLGLRVTAGGEPVRGSLTQDEWFGLPETEGAPRYFFLSAGQLGLWPYLAAAATASVQYQSIYWVAGDKDAMTVDGDTALFDEELVMRGAVWRWRRHVGKDFSDQMAEYEAMLSDRASFDGGVRSP